MRRMNRRALRIVLDDHAHRRVDDTPNHVANSNRPGQPRPDQSVPPTAEEYAERVAGPCMAAVDAMPPVWKQMVDQHGFVDVYLAWRRGLSPRVVHERAERVGGSSCYDPPLQTLALSTAVPGRDAAPRGSGDAQVATKDRGVDVNEGIDKLGTFGKPYSGAGDRARGHTRIFDWRQLVPRAGLDTGLPPRGRTLFGRSALRGTGLCGPPPPRACPSTPPRRSLVACQRPPEKPEIDWLASNREWPG